LKYEKWQLSNRMNLIFKNIVTQPIIIILTLLITLTFYSCSKNNKQVVAEFGNQKITLKEYRIAYLDVIKKPDTFDSPNLREKFLDELIASRVLANEAEKQGYFDNEKLKYKVEAHKNKALRDAHFKNVVRPKFVITEEDIQEAYIYSQEERKISHLFTNTKQEIDSIYSLLSKGNKFEEIAKDLFNDPTLAENGGDLGWVNWSDLEYDLAMIAFRTPTDTFSVPIKSQFGYHILKVTDFKKKPLITRQEYETYKRKSKVKIEFMLGEKYGYTYVNEIFGNAKINIKPQVATRVRSKLKNIFERKPDQYNLMNEMQLTENEVKVVEKNLWDMRHETFATINGQDYRVGEFIGALNYIPYRILYSSFKKAMNYAIRDFIIEQEALDLGLEDIDEVKYKSVLFKEFLLQLELRRDIINAVKVSDDKIQMYYKQNKSKFKDATFDQVEQIIKDILNRKKREEAVPKFVNQLMDNKSVQKNVEIIHNYYDSILN